MTVIREYRQRTILSANLIQHRKAANAGEFIIARSLPYERPDTRASVISIEIARTSDLPEIAKLRHEIYAVELRQHRSNDAAALHDPLDPYIVSIVAKIQKKIVGFVSITPPGAPSYSIEKYVSRHDLPFFIDEKKFEVRLLSVRKSFRGRRIAALLIYAALRMGFVPYV